MELVKFNITLSLEHDQTAVTGKLQCVKEGMVASSHSLAAKVERLSSVPRGTDQEGMPAVRHCRNHPSIPLTHPKTSLI